MRISTKGRYALRLMLDLACQGTDEAVSIKAIAARQEISEKYLEQIVTPLSRAGLLRSTRGAQGGYRLSRAAEEYTVGEILRAIEGNLAPVACIEDSPNRCGRASQCVTVDVWHAIDEAVNGVVDSITLADLVARQRAKAADEGGE